MSFPILCWVFQTTWSVVFFIYMIFGDMCDICGALNFLESVLGAHSSSLSKKEYYLFNVFFFTLL